MAAHATAARVEARYRWVIEGSVLLLQFAMGLNFLAVAPMFPLIIDEYGVSRAAASLLVGATALGVAVALVPASLYGARVGSRAALATGGLLMSAMLLAPFASNFPLLLAARVSFALGSAVVLSSTPAVVMRWFPPRELPLVNGLNVIAQSLGVTTSMLIAASLAASIGWQAALATLACATAAATTLWIVLGRGVSGSVGGDAFSFAALGGVIRNRTALTLGAGAACAIGSNVSFGSWLPTYYNEDFGFTLQEAGAIASLLAVAGIAGSLLGSVLPTRFPARRPYLIAAGLLIPVASFGAFTTAEPVVLYPSLVLLGIAGWLFFPALFTIPMELPGVTPERVGTMVAFVLSTGNLGGFLAPLVVGALRDASGAYTPGLAMAAVLAFGLAVAGFIIPETAASNRHEGARP
jgi:cyanate permease